MQNKLLEQALDLLINHEQDKASALLHEWLVDMTKEVHESIMQDETVTDEIESDKEEIESEEMYGESVDSDDDIADDVSEEGEEENKNEESSEESTEDRLFNLETELERLNATFEKLVDIEEKEHEMDIDGDGVISGIDAEEVSDEDVEDEIGGEADTFDGEIEDVINLDNSDSEEELNKNS